MFVGRWDRLAKGAPDFKTGFGGKAGLIDVVGLFGDGDLLYEAGLGGTGGGGDLTPHGRATFIGLAGTGGDEMEA